MRIYIARAVKKGECLSTDGAARCQNQGDPSTLSLFFFVLDRVAKWLLHDAAAISQVVVLFNSKEEEEEVTTQEARFSFCRRRFFWWWSGGVIGGGAPDYFSLLLIRLNLIKGI